MTALTATVPIRTQGNNAREDWRVKAKRVRTEKAIAGVVVSTLGNGADIALPCVVKLVRMSAGTLDDDNLRGALKATRDAVATWLGIDDGDVSRVRYQYDQEKCAPRVYGVRVTVMPGSVLRESVEKARTA